MLIGPQSAKPLGYSGVITDGAFTINGPVFTSHDLLDKLVFVFLVYLGLNKERVVITDR